MPSRLLTIAAIVAAAVTVAAPAASGDGGPGPAVVQGWDGIARGDVRYVTIPTGRETVLEAVRRDSGRVVRWMFVKGNFGIPQVAFDGTTDGLSRDGRLLVLGDVASSATLTASSSFAVVDVRKFRLREIVRLRGDFSFDALSPNARMLYLIEHVDTQDPVKYRVRAYDLGARRLIPGAVVDKSSGESVSVMQGLPLSRATTKDRRWAYTLYAGGPHPFVHALDTRGGGAVCIDLPHGWSQRDTAGLRLRLSSARRLLVRHHSGGRPLAIIDPVDFRVVSAVRNP
jgi:hypothetical protein